MNESINATDTNDFNVGDVYQSRDGEIIWIIETGDSSDDFPIIGRNIARFKRSYTSKGRYQFTEDVNDTDDISGEDLVKKLWVSLQRN